VKVTETGRILVLTQETQSDSPLLDELSERFEVVRTDSFAAGLRRLREEEFSGLFLLGEKASAATLAQAGGVLEQVDDGFALLDQDLQVFWCNAALRRLSGSDGPTVGRNFYELFGTPEILGPDFCPFHTALGSGETAKRTLRVGEKSYFEVQVTPLFENGEEIPEFLIVVVRDISTEVLQQQKLNAIYQAGLELGDLSAQELMDMSVDERIELLKSKIIHFTKGLLQFDTVEIRLLDKSTGRLDPLLVVGMDDNAATRELYAKPQGNGVTGFVAATGKSYLCEDTQSDPLYLPGAPGARSSLTVPLVLHDEILGTFNVESPEPGAFTENDLQFLELFSREVAMALNTLELLAVEKMTTVSKNTELILREVAKPVDEILNDAAWILERYIGHEPAVCERLQRVLEHTREIKQLIQHVGETMAPVTERHPGWLPRPHRPKFRGKRILVVDSDDAVRSAAHELLARFGCLVETARNAEEACRMVRRFSYDVVIADIRLPDMDGYECFCRLREIKPDLPVILMTGFGYDPTHSIVKARQAGLKSVLYKPFRVDQLLTELEKNF